MSFYDGGAPPHASTLVEVFAATARRYPDAPAIDALRPHRYRDCLRWVERTAERLRAAGVGMGDRVGVRMPSGEAELYLSILAVLWCGAAYVPVDADDPDERARTVWREADVVGVITAGGRYTPRQRSVGRSPAGAPSPEHDAWVIFTSGSTGLPKGVAISHRSAAAFVAAEAQLFLTERPLGPGDRVLAGLSVAFDASCEEMWLAWASGACLVPAPRSLVRAGVELGPWLLERGITVVSTVPTLAALWPVSALRRVRLLILGGEACPVELARRLAAPDREVWNTYGPTEATVVACAAPLDGGEPVRIGLPLRGWQLAVLDEHGVPVPPGGVGELVIGGVGLGRYLDPAKDRERYAPVPALGWPRGYRSGDLVRADPEGLVFLGRADDQVKLGGRRIELGEIDAALLALPGVAAAAAAVRRAGAGGDLLIGYLVPEPGHLLDLGEARARLAEALPAALVPRLVTLDALPTRTSGKVDRNALPWPVQGVADAEDREPAGEGGTLGWLAGLWRDLLAVPVTADADFFELGGTSLATARLVAALRERFPEASVADVYQHPVLHRLAARLDELGGEEAGQRRVHLTPRRAGAFQVAVTVALMMLGGLRWVIALAAFGNLCALLPGLSGALTPPVAWGWLIAGWVLLVSPPGRVLLVVAGVRLVRGGVRPGCYPRGRWVHLRLWAASRLAGALAVGSVAGTPLAAWYARLLGCRVGRNVDLRSDAPVTGLAELGDGCVVEPEADLAGWWLDGDLLHVGEVSVGRGARVGGRATLMPGAVLGPDAEVEPGGCVYGVVPAGERWGGVPARRLGPAGEGWPESIDTGAPGWAFARALTLPLLSLLPMLAGVPWVLLLYRAESARLSAPATAALAVAGGPLVTLCYAVLVVAVVRLAGLAVRPGDHPVASLAGWAAWLVERMVGSARVALFPVYASLLTPVWFRLLGARVGRRVEISTTTGLPGAMRIGDGAFLADDTLVAPYELRGGWLRTGRVRVGERAFVGNSGIVGPEREVPDGALVAVLSEAPHGAAPDTSWVGRPAFELPRVVDEVDPARSFHPPARLVVARASVEVSRVIPLMCGTLLAWLVARALVRLQAVFGWTVAALAAGPVLLLAGATALALTTVAKWLLVGRFRVGEHPLWSSFVWRNELFDVFYEQLAMPWLGNTLLGTPLFNGWLRTLGARIGSGVWCESHWLPETDLVRLADGATVNRGCVLQTHLFHDRLMRIDAVELGPGATLGPHSITLPGVTLGAGVTIGGGSLVMRGESVPARGRWLGNPIAAWPDELAPYPDSIPGRARHLAVRTPRRARTALPGAAALLVALAAAGLAVPALFGDTPDPAAHQAAAQPTGGAPATPAAPGPAKHPRTTPSRPVRRHPAKPHAARRTGAS